MKNILFGSLALVALIGGPAIAADMPVKARPIVDTYNWTGCYTGSVIGATFSRNHYSYGTTGLTAGGTNLTGAPATNDFSVSGYMSGFEAGCNYQAGNIVFGAEGDWSWVGGSRGDYTEGNFPTFRASFEEKSLGTARGRIGVLAWPNVLLYVTGGGAWGRVEGSNYVPNSATITTQDVTRGGWTAGAGFEVAFKGPTLFNMGGWYSFKAEYLYVDLGTASFFSATDPVALAVFNYKYQQHIARFGLNYHFDWGGPVVARY